MNTIDKLEAMGNREGTGFHIHNLRYGSKWSMSCEVKSGSEAWRYESADYDRLADAVDEVWAKYQKMTQALPDMVPAIEYTEDDIHVEDPSDEILF